MSITGFSFFILLLCIWVLYYSLSIRYRWLALLVGSVIFYASFGMLSLAVVLISSIFTYFLARVLAVNHKKVFLAVSIVIAILPLILIKCIAFLPEGFVKDESLLRSMLSIVGISFYTFSSVSYLADVYQGKTEVQRNYGKFLLFLLFFPYILQGPIARYSYLEKQLYQGHIFNPEDNIIGLYSILYGLIKKLIIAERVGLVVNTLFGNSEYYSTIYVALAAALYAFQLYMDFSGYVNIAEGIALLFSIRLQKNFYTPYFSRNISEFWRNWHATLGSWLRDYVYIPLGGNKKGNLRKCINLIIVFGISGIWHGAAWTFVVWGLYHGILSAIHAIMDHMVKEKWIKLRINSESPVICGLQMLHTSALVCIGWIFFRASTMTEALRMICGLFHFEPVSFYKLRVLCRVSALTEYEGRIMIPFILIAILLEWLSFRKKATDSVIAKAPAFLQSIGIIGMIVCIMCFAVQSGGAFMYEVF